VRKNELSSSWKNCEKKAFLSVRSKRSESTVLLESILGLRIRKKSLSRSSVKFRPLSQAGRAVYFETGRARFTNALKTNVSSKTRSIPPPSKGGRKRYRVPKK